MINIRPAKVEDEAIIKKMIRHARLDPSTLKWQNFLIAEVDGKIAGIGQVKPYPGVNELGSLVVLRPYRRQGIASQLMTALENRAGLPLYLLCPATMETFYQQFGYTRTGFWAAPSFLKLKVLPTVLFRLAGIRIIVMRKG